MKRVGWPEQDHLRRTCCSHEMHRGGIDCHKKPRLPDQCSQGKQIGLSRESDDFFLRVALNCCDVRLLVTSWSTRQKKIHAVTSAEAVNYLYPAPGLPEFLLTSRAGM